MPYYYGFDWTYVVLVLPCIILSLWASANVNGTFKRYSQQFSRRGLTGAPLALPVTRRAMRSNTPRTMPLSASAPPSFPLPTWAANSPCL